MPGPAYSLTEVLRDKVKHCGLTYLQLEQATDVKRQSLKRFAESNCSLMLDQADKLADYFKLRLRKRGEG